jgi:peptide/nickel transport system ATP-binding protein
VTVATLSDTVSAVSEAAVSGLVVRSLGVQAKSVDGGRTLVREISFQVGPGETLGIVGESGSGKSMTARSLIGLLPENVVAAGDASFGGTQLIGADERTLRRLRGSTISMVMQDPFTMLNPLQTAAEHIRESLPAALRRDRRRSRAEVASRLAEVGVAPEAGRRYPFQLSGGMRQRVAIAAALAKDPQLLIADEPTTALDVTTQQDVLRLLKRLQADRGMALLLITHDLGVAFTVCDRVLVMYAGSMLERGQAAQLVDDPGHPYTVGLRLADPPVTHTVQQLNSIPGNVPPPDAVADQCAFAARCEWSRDVCVVKRPDPRAIGPDHLSSCVRIDEIRVELLARISDPGKVALGTKNPSAEPLALVSDLRKRYRTSAFSGRGQTTDALSGVSFTIGAGEAVGLVGESGSGKTTIARCMLGLAHPDSGRIEIAGLDVTDYRRLGRHGQLHLHRTVQVVFQDPYASLSPRRSIAETLGEALNVRGQRPADGEIGRLLERVGLPAAYRTRRPAGLSGGERQRVAIARALAVQPTLLICDEPVAALDVSVQAQILELLREIRQETGMSMLFITHDLAVVRQMADRIVVLLRGEVVEEGAAANVLDDPQHPYTQRLLGSVIK